eukprot:gene25859-31227_t
MRVFPRSGLAMASVHRSFSSAPESSIRFSQKNKLLTVELNRPKALNALSVEMCTTMKTLLRDKINAANSDVGAFIMKGVGGKAFCAGGDVKAIWQELQNAHTQTSTNPPSSLTVSDIGTGKPGYLHTDFFRQEYIMNYLIGTSLKPQVSFWDGIVMGGGVGISVLGEFRVATEKSLFAMPETAIGLFPDVGSSAWLPHLPPGCGEFIGLTGWRLGPADLTYSGIATHFIASEKLAEVEAAIEMHLPLDPQESRKHIKGVLDHFQSLSLPQRSDNSSSVLYKHAKQIDACFSGHGSMLEVVGRLEQESQGEGEGAEWAKKTLGTLRKMSPTSLHLTLAQLRRGKSLDLKECLKMEFRLVNRCMSAPDFREGIRA